MELDGLGEFEGADVLQRLPHFARLSYDETVHLAGVLERVDVPAGAVVIEENALGDALYVILEGEVRVDRERGPELVELGRLGPGELFGEMSLVDDLLTSARVSAVRSSRLLRLPRKAFEALLDADDRLAAKVYRSFCRTLSDRLRRANEALAARAAVLGTTVP